MGPITTVPFSAPPGNSQELRMPQHVRAPDVVKLVSNRPWGVQPLLTERQLDYLEDALAQLVCFVVEGADNAYFLNRAAPKLRAAVADYLASRGRDVPPSHPPATVTWSKPVSQKQLREDLEISQDTLRGRLVFGAQPSPGMIRYIGKSEASRKIQVAIEDLPAELHGKYRSLH